MRPAVIPAVIATLLVLVAGALGRDLTDDVVREPLKAAGQGETLTFDFTHSNPVKDIWVTADNQILVELAPDEANRPYLFDLNRRTLVFTPDGTNHVARWADRIVVTRLRRESSLLWPHGVPSEEPARFSLTPEPGQLRIIPDIIDTERRRKGVEGLPPGRGKAIG